MGDRGQVFVNGIFLYSHWGATELIEIVKKALARKERWDDPEYLARIIFQEMLDGDTGATGYGIGKNNHGDIWRLITLDHGFVKVEDYEKVKFDGTFESFLNWIPRKESEEE